MIRRALGGLLRRWIGTQPDRLQVKRDGRFRAAQRRFCEGKVCAFCGRPAETAHHVFPVHAHPELEMDERFWLATCGDSGECHFRWCHCGNWADWNPWCVEDAKLMTARRENRRRKGESP